MVSLQKKRHGVRWAHLWSISGKGLLASHVVWWYSVSTISLVPDRWH